MPADGSRVAVGVDEANVLQPGVEAGVDGAVRHWVLAVRVPADLGEQPLAGVAEPFPDPAVLIPDRVHHYAGGGDGPVAFVLALVVD
jgi:hypothetical protein